MSSIGSPAQMRSATAVKAICPIFASFRLTTIRKLKRGQYRPSILAALLVGLCQSGQAQEAQRANPSTPSGGAVTLFQNVRIFDGKSGTLSGPRNVLVRGNQIERISADPIPTDRSATTVLIDGGGRTLMPGLIDMHWHTMMVRPTPAVLLTRRHRLPQPRWPAPRRRATLMRGFTTVRDLGGPAFGLKRAIDEGIVAGPRIFPSGAVITVTSGHGDFRQPFELPRTLGGPPSRGWSNSEPRMVADSPDEVRVRVREQLMQRRVTDQADGRRRRRIAAQSARRLHLHRAGAARRRRSRRKLGHLRHRARVYAGLDPAGHRRRREMHRTRTPHGRGNRQADRREAASG